MTEETILKILCAVAAIVIILVVSFIVATNEKDRDTRDDLE